MPLPYLPGSRRGGLPYVPGSATSRAAAQAAVPQSKIDARLIFDFIKSRSITGVIADEVITYFDGQIEHSTVTARIKGLKDSRLLVAHPNDLVRKTRKNRDARVFVVPAGADFTNYREIHSSSNSGPKPRVVLAAVRKLVDAHRFGTPEGRDAMLAELIRLHGVEPASRGVFSGLRR
jgi:hypothetical protein